jgi:hypothetical protein
MLVYSKRNILFRSGPAHYLLKKEVFDDHVPDWALEHSYFKALVKDGTIAVSVGTSDKAVDAAIEASDAKDQVKKATKKAKAKE